jgi:hypothetical protein
MSTTITTPRVQTKADRDDTSENSPPDNDTSTDVDLVRPDPKTAWVEFDAAVRWWETRTTDFTWVHATRAFDQLKLSLGSLENEGALADLWKSSKTTPELEALQSFGRQRNWIRQQHPEYKKAKAAYDAENNQTLKRKQQLRTSKSTLRAKKRAERKGGQ